MKQFNMDDLDKAIDQLDTLYPDIAAMNVCIVYLNETGETETYITDTVCLIQDNQHKILKMMHFTHKIGRFQVLTRNKTSLGFAYQCDAVSNLDSKVGGQVLEVQWG